MVIHLNFNKGKHLQLGCLLIIILTSVISSQKIYGQFANVGIGIFNESGGIDTISPGTQPEFAFELCKKQCYKFISLDYSNNPTQGFLVDTFIWDFKTGLPNQTTMSSPTICFNDTASLLMLSLRRSFILYVQGEPPAQIWYYQIFYVKVVNCEPIANFIQSKDVICPNQTISFTDSSYRNPEIWEWEFQGGDPPTWSGNNPPEIKYDIPGFYQVSLSVYNSEGGDTIVKFSSVEVVNGPIRNNDYESNYSGLSGNDTIIHACSIGDTYKWFPSEGLSCDDCDSPRIIFGRIFEYTSIVSVNGGACVDSCKITIRTESEQPKIFFPNVISPNYDGVNDIFEGSWTFADPVQLNIYDRWGGVKFSSKTLFKWDGTYNGQEVSPGVYVYYFVFKNKFTGLDEVKSGSITVLR